MMKSPAFAFLALTSVASAQIVVTTVQDTVDFALPQTVADLPGPDGLVSMREATIAANKTAGPQTIGFAVPLGAWGTGTTGPVIINAGISFGLSGDDTTIDGTTQTAFTGDTNPDGAEVSFFSTTTQIPLIQTGIFVVSGDRNHFIGLGNMLGRNYGIDIQPLGEENTVKGCVIRAVFAAVRIQGDRNVVGGTADGEGNRLDSLADGLRIQGLIGDSTEVPEDNVAIGNVLTGEFNGVQITGGATGNRIGGFLPGEANLITEAGYFQEDNTPDGAMVRIESDGNFVFGNLIGTDATGTAAGNNEGDVGVEIYGDDNVVDGNVIGGITGTIGFLSVQAGVSLREGAEGNVIRGNAIGVDASGAIPIPNGVGIRIAQFDSSLDAPGGNVIGGLEDGDANRIMNNETGGVVVALVTAGNTISGNTIRDNSSQGGIGIDLGADGRTPNDLGDADTGPNDLMNFPRLSSAVGSSQGTVVIGRLDSANPQTAALEFFANSPPLPGVPVEASKFLGTGVPAANGSFVAVLDGDSTGAALTSTATDAAGSTSEISDAFVVQPSPWADAGFAKSGTNGDPALFGGGSLLAGTPVAIVLTNALPSSTGVWILGTTTSFLPLLGGTLVPAPQLILPLATDANGGAGLGGTFPGAPSGTTIVVQAWISDSGAFANAAASNGIIGTVP